MITRIAPLAVKAAVTGRRFSGYASCWEMDYVGDVIVPGAYELTLKYWENSPISMPLVDSHDTYSTIENVVGRMVAAEEDSKGLLCEWEFAKTLRADAALALVRDGFVTGLSIGYKVLRWRSPTRDEEAQGVKRIFEIVHLDEVSLVIRPCHDAARVIQAAGKADPARHFTDTDRIAAEEIYRDLIIRSLTN